MSELLYVDNKVVYSECCMSSSYHNQLILANTQNGMCFKITKECYDILEKVVGQNVTLREFFEWFEDLSDQHYFQTVINILLKYQIIEFVSTINKDEQYSVILMLTKRCNLKCNHCSANADTIEKQDPLSLKDWKVIIDKLSGLKYHTIVITGGEALVREDFFEIVSYVKEKLYGKICYMTNATLVTKDNAAKLSNIFDNFSISLDGADEESCRPIRGMGVFERAIGGIKLLKAEGMKDFSVSLTKVKQNAYCVEKFKKLARSLGAEPMVRNYDVVGRAKEHLELLPEDIDEQFRPMISQPKGLKGHYYPEDLPVCSSCSAGIKKFCISENGDIYPCQVMAFPEFKMGNIMDIESIRDFYISREFENTEGYQNFLNVFPPYSEKCRECPVKTHCTHCALYSYLMMNRSNYNELCKMKREGLMAIWN